MKRLIIIGSMLAAILISGIGSLLWLGQYTEEVAQNLESVAEEALVTPDTALKRLLTIQEDWHQKEHWIGVFVREEPLEQFSDRLEECVVLLRQRQDEDFQVRIRQAIFTIRNIYHQEVPNIENIL